jgi:hypothetical protein
MTPTKADPLYERMISAFGKDRIQHELNRMISTWGNRDPLHHLTDDARNELIYRLISDFKFDRKIRTANRRLNKERAV